ncbi:hypothetical protein Taro_039781 [Colocasia esculenta]|uniref:Uncharacterized protein n=1 Tax=Colocasia esculenta TaxID=4460 RepID=A0A843WA61_COLES|nr:hypothetical protein [Colocasia esculenta]
MYSERRPGGIQGGFIPFGCEGRPGGIQGGCIPFRLKEDQLRLGVRIREGDSTLDSDILRYCSGTGCRSPVERSSEPG